MKTYYWTEFCHEYNTKSEFIPLNYLIHKIPGLFNHLTYRKEYTEFQKT